MKRLMIYIFPIFFIAACCDKENGNPCQGGRELINDSCQCPPGFWEQGSGIDCSKLTSNDYLIYKSDCGCFDKIKFSLGKTTEDVFGNKEITVTVRYGPPISGVYGGSGGSGALYSPGVDFDTIDMFLFDVDDLGEMCLKPAENAKMLGILNKKTGVMDCTITTYSDGQQLNPLESCRFWMSNNH